MSQIEYFKIPKGFSRWLDGLDWSETCDAVVVKGGPTLALGTALAQFLEGAFRNTQPIHFAYVLHFLASAKYEDDQWRRLHDLGFAVNRNSGALFSALTRQVPRLDFDFDMAETRHLLLQHTELVSVHWLETSSADIAGDATSFDSGVAQAIQSLSDDDIKHWLRHGRGPLPDTGKTPDAPKREQSFTELVERLLKSPRLAGVSDLMQQVIAAVSIPPHSQRRTELPVGGYSSIVNRGQPDQILMSEHAVDELEFLRRYANNELLYWQREEPQNQQAEELCIVLDQGVRTWGEPRLALTAAALALGKQAEKAEMLCKFVFSSPVGACCGKPLQETSQVIQASDLTSNPAQALRQALSEASTVKDIILLTHPKNLDEPELTQAASEQSENQRLFAITVDEKGNGTLQQLTTSGQVKLRTFELDIQPPRIETPIQKASPESPWTGDIDPLPMPFNLGLVEMPLALGLAVGGRYLVAVFPGMISIWELESRRVSSIYISNRRWSTTFGVQLVETPEGVFVRADCDVDAFVGLSLDFSRKTATIGPDVEPELNSHLTYCDETQSLISLSSNQPVLKRVNGVWVEARPNDQKPQELPDQGVFLAILMEDASFLVADGVYGNEFLVDPKTGECATWVGETSLCSRPELDGRPAFKSVDFTQKRKIPLCHKTADLIVVEGPSARFNESSIALVFSSKDLTLLGSISAILFSYYKQVSASGNRVAFMASYKQAVVREYGSETREVFQTSRKKIHSQLNAELGQNWLTLHGGKFTHLLRWDRGPLEISFMQGQKDVSDFVQKRRDASVLNPHGSVATPAKLTETYRHRWQKQCFKGKLTLLSDNTGNVAVLGDEDRLVVMFHVYRGTIAAWMPDGTRYGPASLTGGSTTKGALDKIGAALSEASI